MFTPTERMEIWATSRRNLDDRLETAVRELRETAIHERTRGILIIRRQPGHYTAELSDKVPFGLTMNSFADMCKPRPHNGEKERTTLEGRKKVPSSRLRTTGSSWQDASDGPDTR